MIKTEYYGKNGLGIDLYKTYSDENKIIRQIETGIEYNVAIDVGDKYDPIVDTGHESEKIRYTYDETDKYINDEIPEDDYATEEDYIEALNKLGVE